MPFSSRTARILWFLNFICPKFTSLPYCEKKSCFLFSELFNKKSYDWVVLLYYLEPGQLIGLHMTISYIRLQDPTHQAYQYPLYLFGVLVSWYRAVILAWILFYMYLSCYSAFATY